jgi:hypothetical protein
MKNLFKFSLLLAVVFVTINVHASDVDFSLGVKKEQGRLVSFVLSEAKKMDLSIYDANNNLIHSENLNSQKNVNRTYDLTALPEGTYFLVAETEVKIAKYKIIVDDNAAKLSDTAISEIYKPVFVEKDGLVTLSIVNLDKSPIEIKIFDDEGNEIYESDTLVDQNISKVFDVKNIQSKRYTFLMTYNDKSFFKTFYKN